MSFFLLVCKLGRGGIWDCHITRANSDYTRVTCEHLMSPNSFISHRLALRTVTPKVLAVKRTQLDQTGDNTAIHHCAPETLCPSTVTARHASSHKHTELWYREYRCAVEEPMRALLSNGYLSVLGLKDLLHLQYCCNVLKPRLSNELARLQLHLGHVINKWE